MKPSLPIYVLLFHVYRTINIQYTVDVYYIDTRLNVWDEMNVLHTVGLKYANDLELCSMLKTFMQKTVLFDAQHLILPLLLQGNLNQFWFYNASVFRLRWFDATLMHHNSMYLLLKIIAKILKCGMISFKTLFTNKSN